MFWYIRAWNSLRKQGFSWKWKLKIAEQNIFCGEKNRQAYFFFLWKLRWWIWMQIEGRKLIFSMNFSVLDFFKFASRMPQTAQILVSTFNIFQGSMPPDPSRYFLFFSLAIPGSDTYSICVWLANSANMCVNRESRTPPGRRGADLHTCARHVACPSTTRPLSADTSSNTPVS